MASSNHTRDNRACCVCETKLHADSYVGSLTRKSTEPDTPRLVCRDCHDAYYSEGE